MLDNVRGVPAPAPPAPPAASIQSQIATRRTSSLCRPRPGGAGRRRHSVCARGRLWGRPRCALTTPAYSHSFFSKHRPPAARSGTTLTLTLDSITKTRQKSLDDVCEYTYVFLPTVTT
ncbi:hypothetical protein EVAR_35346_1 [Eumeta japonica]|uniref:Uncharacterized protein n=1 Tax=Eumeta variegata TaxID=151549 RepID=A0A4C1XHT1_EUMVA|nr:hypothetical protein EVAR_35346_1 [Eumeta japonica]